ncbi:MAG: pectin acetylesterase-family hydrolase [Alphaproteobacteria bacterium]
MGRSALALRVQRACARAVASLEARSFGGPHVAVRRGASESDRRCLDGAFRDGLALLDSSARRHGACLRDAASGLGCDAVALSSGIEERVASTARRIGRRCAKPLDSLVAIDARTFADRAAAQARCLGATAHGDTAPLALDCRPRPAVDVPARGVTTQVILPAAQWGTKCGDGSDYAFRVRLAPPGSPVENVVVHLQGGGVCISGTDCASRDPDLFEAASDAMPDDGILSSTAAANPFRDWTKVFLPYCTQDLHAGGGVASVFPERTVERYGAVDVRAAMSWVRDAIWTVLDAEDAAGYRADRPRVVFGGTSAGGYGVLYNYHWVLDDLGWKHTAALPDAAVAMDAGPAGVVLLGLVAGLPGSPGWGAKPFRAPYCFSADCMEIVTNLERATAPRLLGAPEQRILNVTNQVDEVQRSTTLFPSMPAFVNELRAGYCDLAGTRGVQWFLRGSSSSIHGQVENGWWDAGAIDGVAMRDWVGGAMADPAGLVDRVEEGTLVADVPGVLPFPCALP